jgi:poly-gamma-glutamate synthesis protein (capsule biosynthesis protein)
LDIREVKGVKFGFLAYNGIEVPPLNREVMASEIKKSKELVDILVASIHWGKEYELLPVTDGKIAPDNPREIGRLMIDSGVDLVIGNHPHWVQGVEIYRDKLITYAHGNFIFDQTWSRETQEGVVGKYTFYENQLVQVSYHPILVDGSYRPRFVSGKDAEKIINQMKQSTQQLVAN